MGSIFGGKPKVDPSIAQRQAEAEARAKEQEKSLKQQQAATLKAARGRGAGTQRSLLSGFDVGVERKRETLG